jgi:hypothetical protein
MPTERVARVGLHSLCAGNMTAEYLELASGHLRSHSSGHSCDTATLSRLR